MKSLSERTDAAPDVFWRVPTPSWSAWSSCSTSAWPSSLCTFCHETSSTSSGNKDFRSREDVPTERCKCCLAVGVWKGLMVFVLLVDEHSSRTERRFTQNHLGSFWGSCWGSLKILHFDRSAGIKRIRTVTYEDAPERSGRERVMRFYPNINK